MGAPVFVVDRSMLSSGATVLLDGPEGRHAATVQRLRVGEQLVLTDGAGTSARGTVVSTGRDSLQVQLGEVTAEPEPVPRFVVVQALAKGDRAELAVATATEVGADVVVPWAASRSVARWAGERGGRSLERWRATACEAAKQSRRTRFPEVTASASTDDVCTLLAAAALGLVLHEEASRPVADLPLPAAGDVVLVVGPEGGIAPDELSAFETAGGSVVRLGPTVLRTSTAAAAALAVLLSRTERWA